MAAKAKSISVSAKSFSDGMGLGVYMCEQHTCLGDYRVQSGTVRCKEGEGTLYAKVPLEDDADVRLYAARVRARDYLQSRGVRGEELWRRSVEMARDEVFEEQRAERARAAELAELERVRCLRERKEQAIAWFMHCHKNGIPYP